MQITGYHSLSQTGCLNRLCKPSDSVAQKAASHLITKNKFSKNMLEMFVAIKNVKYSVLLLYTLFCNKKDERV